MQEKTSVISNSKHEALIVGAVMITILLPVRILFYNYVSTDWFSSFGLIAGISILMVVLAKKNKLGKFGKMFQRQMLKIQHGKRGKIIYGYTIFIAIMFSILIYSVHQGNTEFLDVKEQILFEMQNVDQIKANEFAQDIQIQDWAIGIIGFFVSLFIGSPETYALISILNDIFDGWLLHFYTVGLVESLEILGVLMFYRITMPKLSKTQ